MKEKKIKYCMNGDGNPVCPPSKVICKECMDKIALTFEKMRDKMKSLEKEEDPKNKLYIWGSFNPQTWDMTVTEKEAKKRK